MIKFIPFNPGHLDRFMLQPSQEYLGRMVSDPIARLNAGKSRSAWSGVVDGRIVGSAGVLPVNGGAGYCWALLSNSIPKSSWVRITRFVISELDKAQRDGMRNLYTTVKEDFCQGHEWAKILGFIRAGNSEIVLGVNHLVYQRYK